MDKKMKVWATRGVILFDAVAVMLVSSAGMLLFKDATIVMDHLAIATTLTLLALFIHVAGTAILAEIEDV